MLHSCVCSSGCRQDARAQWSASLAASGFQLLAPANMHVCAALLMPHLLTLGCCACAVLRREPQGADRGGGAGARDARRIHAGALKVDVRSGGGRHALKPLNLIRCRNAGAFRVDARGDGGRAVRSDPCLNRLCAKAEELGGARTGGGGEGAASVPDGPLLCAFAVAVVQI